MSPRKRYCQFIVCTNNKGSKDPSERFFSLPKDEVLKEKWIKAIEQHQKFIPNVNLICMRHFQSSDFEKKGKVLTLRKTAVPGLVETVKNVEDELPFSPSNQCLQDRISTLEKELFASKINHDLLIQKLRRTNSIQKDKLQQMQKDLAIERSRNKQLENENANLKKMMNNENRDQEVRNEYLPVNIVCQFKISFSSNILYQFLELIHFLRLGVSNRIGYPPSVRAFAIGLFNISPRAYAFVRQKVNNHLPYKSTIQQWYRNSELDSTSGIGQHSLKMLGEKAKEMSDKNEQLVVSVVLDEMAIQRFMSWCRATNRFIGLIERGTPVENEDFNLAKKVIVFMVCGVNAKFEQPVGYFFIQSLKYNHRAEVVTELLTEITKRGIRVANLTFDGDWANFKMCMQFGADLDNEEGNYIPSFQNPHDNSKINVILDPSHMIKLMRNYFGQRLLWDNQKRPIRWQFIVNLVNYSRGNNLGLAHKLNKRHIEFANRPMYVRTAVEILSSSTANALEHLLKNNVPGFKGAEGTIEFIRICDQLWDIMNTQNIDNNHTKFKSAINPANCEAVFKFLMNAKSYFLSLYVLNKKTKKRQKGINSDVKTGFRGIIINIISITEMYRELVEQKQWLLFFATYRLSQDHIEMFFARIRLLNGEFSSFHFNQNILYVYIVVL